jgi:cytochrome c
VSSLEGNKVAAAILIALIVGIVSVLLSEAIVGHAHDPGEVKAFRMEVSDAPTGEAGAGAAPAVLEAVSSLMASANAENGAKLFKKCAACHTVDKGGPNRVGPNLWNTMGAPKAHVAGFAYSDGMKGKGGAWSYEDMNHWLYNPKEFVPGTKMNFAGLKNVKDRADLIMYLRSLSDAPKPLP